MTDAELIVKALTTFVEGGAVSGDDLKRLALLATRGTAYKSSAEQEPSAHAASHVDSVDLADNPDAPPLGDTIHVPGDDPSMGRGGFR